MLDMVQHAAGWAYPTLTALAVPVGSHGGGEVAARPLAPRSARADACLHSTPRATVAVVLPARALACARLPRARGSVVVAGAVA